MGPWGYAGYQVDPLHPGERNPTDTLAERRLDRQPPPRPQRVPHLLFQEVRIAQGSCQLRRKA